jgi:CheY-like chemotaxis protein
MRLCLLHWHPDEAAEHAKQLRALGHTMVNAFRSTPEAAQRIRANPPDLFLICLDRLPSHGREAAGALREWKTTRQVPIVFVGGQPDQIARAKQSLPDAQFTSWAKVGDAIKRAMANPPSLSALPDSRFAGYSGTPLPKKLGIKAGSRVALVSAPKNFATTLGGLPAGAKLHSSPRGKRDLTIWFVRSLKELRAAIPRMVDASRQGGVWIAWPKRASSLATDVSETEVRAQGLAAGLVDHKICAIDPTWSGLRFALRKPATPTR